MSLPDNKLNAGADKTGPVAASTAGGQREGSPRWLAHELANLLDGSMRNVSLALSRLRQGALPGHGTGDSSLSPADEERLVQRLSTANEAMLQMATLIQRWLHRLHQPIPWHADRRTLSQAVADAVNLLQPAAEAWGIAVRTEVTDDAANLPAGPVQSVLLNALQNSIEAIAAASGDGTDGPHGAIDVRVRVAEGCVDLAVDDDGPGLDAALVGAGGGFVFGRTTKPDGHGIGLALARQIAAGLGGQLHIANRQPRGVRLTLRYPLPPRRSAGGDQP